MTNTVAVIAGRFQLAELHAGHQHLIETALSKHDAVLILVGVHQGQPTDRNPLDFATRANMLRGAYPQCVVDAIADARTNQHWSQQLDALVKKHFPDHEPVLVGSRDSFLSSYEGSAKKQYIEPLADISATAVRNQVTVEDSPAFRNGVIHAITKQRFPTAYPVVDVAILHTTAPLVLLGRKADETKWRFVGGFVDPTDVSLEAAVRREVREEVGAIEIADITYRASMPINDFRYRGTSDGIISTFFTATYIFGAPQASDDLEEVRWFEITKLTHVLTSQHLAFVEVLNNLIKENHYDSESFQ